MSLQNLVEQQIISSYTDLDFTSNALVLNAGLPWTNPLKLQIGSDEHIIDTTINRGLMMLLNNDYYLDMKDSLLSKELSDLLNNQQLIKNAFIEHINNTDMHYTNQTSIINKVENSYYFNNNVNVNSDSASSKKLTKDTIKYLSIGWNAAKIQQVIDETPHDLNGFNLLFLFVVPVGYLPKSENIYSLDIDNNNIHFDNFHHGTLIVLGDWLHENNYFKKFTYKSDKQIEDPEKYDSLNIKKYISNFQNSIDDSESIDDIINFESNKEQYYNKSTDLNKIIIKGTALNDRYSIVSFCQNTAQIYVKNIVFESSLVPLVSSSTEIDLSNFINKSLPPSEQLVFMWPLQDDTTPILNDYIENIIKADQVEPIFNSLSTYTSAIDNEVLVLVDNLTFIKNEVNNEATSANLCSIFINSDLSAYKLSSEISKVVDSLNDTFTPIIDNFNQLNENPDYKFLKFNLNDYINTGNGEFKSSDYITDVTDYCTTIASYLNNLTRAKTLVNFNTFLKARTDLIKSSDEFISGTLLDDELISSFISSMLDIHNDNIMNTISNINDNILVKISNNVENLNSKELSFDFGENEPIFANVSKNDSYEQNIKFESNSDTVKALYLNEENNIYHFEYAYLSSDNEMTHYLCNTLFNPNTIFNIENIGQQSTLCFWTKLDTTKIALDNSCLLSLKIKSQDSLETYELVINPTTIKSYDNQNNESSITLLNDVYTTHKNDWLFWEIKFDFSQLAESSKLGINPYVYTYKIDDDGKKYVYKNILNISDIYKTVDFKFDPSKKYLMDMYIGYNSHVGSAGLINSCYNGYFRNLMVIRGEITDKASESLFEEGIQELYNLESQYYSSSITNVIKNGNFFIGLVSSYDNNNINIINCIMKHNGKSYII